MARRFFAALRRLVLARHTRRAGLVYFDAPERTTPWGVQPEGW